MYGTFLIIELGRNKGVLKTQTEYDLLWETAQTMYKDFLTSDYNIFTFSEYIVSLII
jgi:hypothetical protein